MGGELIDARRRQREADLGGEAVDQPAQRRGDVGIVATDTGMHLRLLLAVQNMTILRMHKVSHRRYTSRPITRRRILPQQRL